MFAGDDINPMANLPMRLQEDRHQPYARDWNLQSGLRFALAWICLMLSAGAARSDERKVVLGYLCATFQSARSVALERTWNRRETMPDDCHTLFGRPIEERFAVISEVIEVLPAGDGRWIEVGKVRRGMVESGYSAGFSDRLLLH